MTANTYLVFDFETTGLHPAHDRIIQVGLCSVANGETTSRLSWLVKQDVPIHPDATRIHGITVEQMAKHGISPDDSVARLMEAIRTAQALVGHNMHRFDVPFLLAECRRLGVEPPNCVDFIDTAALFKGMKLDLPKRPSESHQNYANRILSIRAPGLRYSIAACTRELMIPTDGTDLHDAGQDAYVTHLIYQALRSRVPHMEDSG